MRGLVEHLLNLHGLAAVAVVFAMPALEASAFVGFVFPGEIAVILGGVLAFQHRISLAAALAAAISGAVIGDSVGYAIGRRWGARLLNRLPHRLVRPQHVEKGKAVLQRFGGRAVFFGRFTAALRVLVPGLSGMAELPYRTFLLWNVAGGLTWATSYVLVGYFAGNGWRRVESKLSTGSLVALAVIAIAGAAWYLRHRHRRSGVKP